MSHLKHPHAQNGSQDRPAVVTGVLVPPSSTAEAQAPGLSMLGESLALDQEALSLTACRREQDYAINLRPGDSIRPPAGYPSRVGVHHVQILGRSSDPDQTDLHLRIHLTNHQFISCSSRTRFEIIAHAPR